MIQILIDGQELVLGQNSLNLKGKSPLLDRNQMPGIRNLPFKVPALDANRKLLGFADDIHKSELPEAVPCQVMLHGSLLLEGELLVQEATELWIECQVSDPLSLFAEEYGEKSIRTLDLGTVSYGSQKASTTFEIQSSTPGVGYTITLNGNTYQYIVQVGDSIATITNALANAINTDWPGYANVSGALLQFLIVAQPNVGDEYELSWAPTSTSSIWDIPNRTSHVEARQQNWEAWYNDVVDNPDYYDYCLPVINAPKLYGGSNARYNGYGNWWTPTMQYNSKVKSEEWEWACLPCVYMLPVLEALFADLGYSLEVDDDFASSRNLSNLYLLNLYSIDEVLREYEEVGDEFLLCNVFQYTFSLARMLPAMTYAELIKGVRVALLGEFIWKPNEKKVILQAADKALQATEVTDWQERLVGKYRLRYLHGKGYTFSHKEVEPSLAEQKNMYRAVPYVHGEGEEKIENTLGVVDVIQDQPIGSQRRAPYTNQEGYSDYFDLGYGEWPGMLSQYRGFLGGPNDYPLGTADHKDKDGNAIDAAFSLGWEGSQGLIQSFYERWLHFMDRTRAVELLLDPDGLTPAELDFFKPILGLHTQWVLGEYTLKVPSKKGQKVVIYRL